MPVKSGAAQFSGKRLKLFALVAWSALSVVTAAGFLGNSEASEKLLSADTLRSDAVIPTADRPYTFQVWERAKKLHQFFSRIVLEARLRWYRLRGKSPMAVYKGLHIKPIAGHLNTPKLLEWIALVKSSITISPEASTLFRGFTDEQIDIPLVWMIAAAEDSESKVMLDMRQAQFETWYEQGTMPETIMRMFQTSGISTDDPMRNILNQVLSQYDVFYGKRPMPQGIVHELRA